MKTELVASILVVEDEKPMRNFLRASLGSRGFRVLEAERASEALIILTSHSPEIMLLDLGLPDADGVEFTRQVREWSAIPILVISARGREGDKVAALDAGADDYLTKPFGVDELLARIRVSLRHSRRSASASDEPIVECGGVRIDLANRQVFRGTDLLKLTPIEYKLLAMLARHAGKVLTHQQILREVWGPRFVTQSHYVRVFMAELRKKIEADPARPRLLITEQGVGYRLRSDK